MAPYVPSKTFYQIATLIDAGVRSNVRISHIDVAFSDIIDKLTITYEASTGTQMKEHGGTDGAKISFDLARTRRSNQLNKCKAIY